VRLRFTELAAGQAEAEDSWWRENREKAPALFQSELEEALLTLATVPEAGPLYGILDDTPMRRVQLKKTRCHLYYSVEADEIVIHFVWGARRGDRPAPPGTKSSIS
jgi:plasmid stabilization system protein ParE